MSVDLDIMLATNQSVGPRQRHKGIDVYLEDAGGNRIQHTSMAQTKENEIISTAKLFNNQNFSVCWSTVPHGTPFHGWCEVQTIGLKGRGQVIRGAAAYMVETDLSTQRWSSDDCLDAEWADGLRTQKQLKPAWRVDFGQVKLELRRARGDIDVKYGGGAYDIDIDLIDDDEPYVVFTFLLERIFHSDRHSGYGKMSLSRSPSSNRLTTYKSDERTRTARPRKAIHASGTTSQRVRSAYCDSVTSSRYRRAVSDGDERNEDLTAANDQDDDGDYDEDSNGVSLDRRESRDSIAEELESRKKRSGENLSEIVKISHKRQRTHSSLTASSMIPRLQNIRPLLGTSQSKTVSQKDCGTSAARAQGTSPTRETGTDEYQSENDDLELLKKQAQAVHVERMRKEKALEIRKLKDQIRADQKAIAVCNAQLRSG